MSSSRLTGLIPALQSSIRASGLSFPSASFRYQPLTPRLPLFTPSSGAFFSSRTGKKQSDETAHATIQKFNQAFNEFFKPKGKEDPYSHARKVLQSLEIHFSGKIEPDTTHLSHLPQTDLKTLIRFMHEMYTFLKRNQLLNEDTFKMCLFIGIYDLKLKLGTPYDKIEYQTYVDSFTQAFMGILLTLKSKGISPKDSYLRITDIFKTICERKYHSQTASRPYKPLMDYVIAFHALLKDLESLGLLDAANLEKVFSLGNQFISHSYHIDEAKERREIIQKALNLDLKRRVHFRLLTLKHLINPCPDKAKEVSPELVKQWNQVLAMSVDEMVNLYNKIELVRIITNQFSPLTLDDHFILNFRNPVSIVVLNNPEHLDAITEESLTTNIRVNKPYKNIVNLMDVLLLGIIEDYKDEFKPDAPW